MEVVRVAGRVTIIMLTLLGICGCSARDTSVRGRVELMDSDEWPEYQELYDTGPVDLSDVPPVVLPGQATRDSLKQLPDDAEAEPSSE